MYWKLNRIQYPIYNLGRGKRIGIWTQGCSIGCAGCVNKELWPVDKGKKIDVQLLASQILNFKNDYDGLTITGGEPFDQYEPLITFCSFLKLKSNIEIFCFSGYTLKQLKQKFPDMLFTKCMDFLLDGPYISELAENKNSRGSSNQKLYKFGNGKIFLPGAYFQSDIWSVDVSENNEVFMAGIPKKDDLKKLKNTMKNSGIKLEVDNV